MDRRTKEFKAAQAAEVAPVRRRATTEAGAASVVAQPAPSALVAATAPTDAVAPKFRRQRASTGGMKLKLDAPKRPGFVRRFVKNDPSRIMAMHGLGYDFAEADTRTDDLGTRITRYAGKGEHGNPEHLVLMETPASEYAIGVAEKEEQRQPFEQALRAGRATSGELTDQYQPGSAKTSYDNSGRT